MAKGQGKSFMSTGSLSRLKDGLTIVLILALLLGGVGIWAGWLTMPNFSMSSASASNGATIISGTGTGTNTQNVCPFPVSQTLYTNKANADQHQTAVTTTDYIFSDPDKGIQVSNLTMQNGKYTVMSNATSGYFAAKSTIATGCDANPTLQQYLKAADTSITMTTYNVGGRTANTAAANQSVGLGGSASMSVELTPSAQYKHLSGEINKYSVWFNATYSQNWSAGDFSVTSIDGTPCKPTTQRNPTAMTGNVLIGFDCTGDFSGMDQNIYKMPFTVKASATINPGEGDIMSICVAGWDHYISKATTGFNGGNIMDGAVLNDGTVLHALQCATIYPS